MQASYVDFRLSVAPMLDWTDRHFRYFLRGITRRAWLYTEMVPTSSLIYGDRKRFLSYDPCEHPLVLQLGGNQPKELAECARMAEDYGYDEINLNVGCPSDKVAGGNFGACLMANPELVAECISAMQAAVSLPVSIKCRIGIATNLPSKDKKPLLQKQAAQGRDFWEENYSYETLSRFIRVVSEAACKRFIIHARIAVLGGLSPKANRQVPPLRYDLVHKLKRDFPEPAIELNGGLRDVPMALREARGLEGAMIGRAAYENPSIFFYENTLQKNLKFMPSPVMPRHADSAADYQRRREAALRMIPYLEKWKASGGRYHLVTRHMLGLFAGLPGARRWRRILSDAKILQQTGSAKELIEEAMPNFCNQRKKLLSK